MGDNLSDVRSNPGNLNAKPPPKTSNTSSRIPPRSQNKEIKHPTMPSAEQTVLESDYVDYEVYLEDSFSPIAFANSLVQATNDSHDAEVDLSTPSKRLRYDLEEVEQRIKDLTANNYEELITQAASAGTSASTLPPLRASLDHVNSSYAKLQRDILTPYYNAQKLYTALRRLHVTSGMLRSLTWYLYLARQLAMLMKAFAGPTGVPESPRSVRAANLEAIEPKDLLQAGQTLLELRAQLVSEPGLRSLQVIRIHEASLGRIENKLVLHCQNVIKFYRSKSGDSSGDSSIVRTSSPSLQGSPAQSTISNSSFNADYETLVTHACYTLFLLKPETLASSIQKFHLSQVSASVNEIVRSLTSLNMSMSRFNTAFSAASERAQTLYTLNVSLESFNKPFQSSAQTSAVPEQSELLLWEFVSSSLDVKSLSASYWRDLARNLEQQIREFTLNNPNMTKTIRFKNYPSTNDIVDTFAVRPFTREGSKFAPAAAGPQESRLLAKSLVSLFR